MTKSSNRSDARQKPGWGPGLAIGGSMLLAFAIGLGVNMSVSNFYLTGDHLFINVCFAALGPERRMIGPATLTHANGDSSAFGVHSTLDATAAGSDTLFKHRDTLAFQHLPVGARLSHLSLSVRSVSFSATAPVENPSG